MIEILYEVNANPDNNVGYRFRQFQLPGFYSAQLYGYNSNGGVAKKRWWYKWTLDPKLYDGNATDLLRH